MTLVVGPCNWTPTHTHHSAADLAEWNAYPANIRTFADQVAAAAVWGATGRRFGLCDTIARPIVGCIHWSEWDLTALPEYPTYMGNGEWIGLPAMSNCCIQVNPQSATLDGPVNAITQVTIDGVVVAAANYRVDEGMYLVRTDGGTWPLWQDVDLAGGGVGTFVVTYQQGLPIPTVVLAASGTYALEVARSASGATTCRLPSRATSITRQGVTIDLIDPTTLLEAGLTGIPEVDAIIQAYNPGRLIRPLRVLVPGVTARRVGA